MKILFFDEFPTHTFTSCLSNEIYGKKNNEELENLVLCL